MEPLALPLATQTYDHVPLTDLGSISIRVIVLPPKGPKDQPHRTASVATPVDADPEEMLPETGATPLGSYLESSKGKRCCVFLVNGQRQDFLDNSFIVQDLKFRYLRNRMMIVVDVDDLSNGALGRLMQGSRQGFYRGDIWHAMMRRVAATLKNDPELLRLEEEAEEQVSELKTGDETVKQTLDQLIQAHHEHGLHVVEGTLTAGDQAAADQAGLKTETKGGIVTLLPPDLGQAADYPVLFSQPGSSVVRLRPNQDREISIKVMPSNAWPALATLGVDPDPTVPELNVETERLEDHAKLKFSFRQPPGFDTDQYPVRAKVRVTATFNGIEHRRQLTLQVVIKPDAPPQEPVLVETPTKLTVSSRQPVNIERGSDDTHVRLRWDGKDKLLLGSNPMWRRSARLSDEDRAQPNFNFSDPTAGRFSLLIAPRPEWVTGERLNFEVTAEGPAGQTLRTHFVADIVDPPQEPKDERAPRLVDGEYKAGGSRRPPYELKYIDRDEYETIPCWGPTSWTDDDPGCFQAPTERQPLMLIINNDMEALREYRRYLTRKYTETEVKRRTTRYTSHIAFHLYQMYQATVGRKEDLDEADAARREEIKRVSLTLIKLMEVAR